MAEVSENRMAGNSSPPSLYPFITLREESFGALVFNPFFATERTFGPVEGSVIRRLDGKRPVSQLARELAEERAIPMEAAVAVVETTLTQLKSMYAVDENGGAAATAALETAASKPAPVDACATPSSELLSSPKSIIWELTRACNLRCMHCLTRAGDAGSPELDLKGAFRVIEVLEEAKVLRLFLSGGEPFVHPHILEVIERLSESNMYFDIGTNGVDVPESFFQNLSEYRLFLVQVSIDGIGSRHDYFRCREGAFAAATRTIERLKEADINVTISTTATAANFDQIEKIIDWAAGMGCSSFKSITFIPAGRGKDNSKALKLTPEQYRSLSMLLKRKQAEMAPRMSVEVGTTMSFLLDPCAPSAESSPLARTQPFKIGCAAGTDTLYIGADGTAFPCPFFLSFPLGNIVTTPIASLWRDSPFLNYMRNLTEARVSEECRKCRYLGAECNAGCRASAYLEHGNLSAMDPSCFKEC